MEPDPEPSFTGPPGPAAASRSTSLDGTNSTNGEKSTKSVTQQILKYSSGAYKEAKKISSKQDLCSANIKMPSGSRKVEPVLRISHSYKVLICFAWATQARPLLSCKNASSNALAHQVRGWRSVQKNCHAALTLRSASAYAQSSPHSMTAFQTQTYNS